MYLLQLGHFDPVMRTKVDPNLCVSNLSLRSATQVITISNIYLDFL